MRYTPKQLEAIRTNALLLRHDPRLGIDPIAYSLDLFFIDDYLRESFYPTCDGLGDSLHWRSRMDFCCALLKEYYSSDASVSESHTSHWQALEAFLENCSERDAGDPLSLLSIFAGT